MESPFKKLKPTKTIEAVLGAEIERPKTKLTQAVPVADDEETTVITLHTHKIIIERQDNLYKTLAFLEGILLLTSSLLMISLSAAAIVFAFSMVTGVL